MRFRVALWGVRYRGLGLFVVFRGLGFGVSDAVFSGFRLPRTRAPIGP